MEIIYWNDKVCKLIDSLDKVTSSKVRNLLLLLEKYGHLLDMPDSKSLGKGLFELRTRGKMQVRLMYIFHGNRVYVIHGFVKKAWKIGLKDMKYARRVQEEIIRLA